MDGAGVVITVVDENKQIEHLIFGDYFYMSERSRFFMFGECFR